MDTTQVLIDGLEDRFEYYYDRLIRKSNTKEKTKAAEGLQTLLEAAQDLADIDMYCDGDKFQLWHDQTKDFLMEE